MRPLGAARFFGDARGSLRQCRRRGGLGARRGWHHPGGPANRRQKRSGTEAAITDLFATDDAVWASAKGEGLVPRLDPRSSSVVASIATGAGAHDIAVDANGVWVTNYRDNNVSRIDPTTNTVAATIDGVGSGVRICACDGGIMVSTQGQGVSRIDPRPTASPPWSRWTSGTTASPAERGNCGSRASLASSTGCR